MTAVTRPRGPLPARVYWTRRLVVLAVALGLVFGLGQLLGGSGDGGADPSARPVGAQASSSSSSSTSGAPTTAATDGPTTPSEPVSGATGTATKGATPSATTLAEPSGPCVDSDIVATPKVKGTAYAARLVVFTVTLTTKASPACRWDVSAETLAVKVTSGSDRIWTTQDCTGAVPRQSLVVRKDHPATVAVAWNGLRSDADCSRSTSWAQPGYYHVAAAAFGSDPVDEQFVLHLMPRATITTTPSPDAETSRQR